MTLRISRRQLLGGAAPVAAISDRCFAVEGIYCRSCGDVCAERAIGFTLLPGGRAVAAVDPDLCTGCGDCAPVCPASAISLPHAPRTASTEAANV